MRIGGVSSGWPAKRSSGSSELLAELRLAILVRGAKLRFGQLILDRASQCVAVDREDLDLDLPRDLEAGCFPRRVGKSVLVLVVLLLDFSRGRLGHLGQELLHRNLDQLCRDPLVLLAVIPENVVGSDQRRVPEAA